MPVPQIPGPCLHHTILGTSFCGIEHSLSSPEAQIHQYRGIKYASVPARFRQSKINITYPAITDASKFGPICPQPSGASFEDKAFGPPPAGLDCDAPRKQNEFECLNLNVTCPAGLTPDSGLPVMVWVHGGGTKGSGSSWAYDGGAVVKRSIKLDKPIILITFNFRLGLFGNAANRQLLADNAAAGDEGVGNYGLHDQRQALNWIHEFISQFGGSPENITLFGSTTGAADILSHLLSSFNQKAPLFHRAILQSPLVDPCPPTVSLAGSHLSRTLCSLVNGRPLTPENLRNIPSEALADITAIAGVARATNDGIWFREGWADYIAHTTENNSRSSSSSNRRSRSRISAALAHFDHLQPIIIGDSSSSSYSPGLHSSSQNSSSVGLWTSPLLARRLKAICLSMSKSAKLISAYDLDIQHADGWSHDTDEEMSDDSDDFEEHVKELVQDARIAWPTDCIANAAVKENRKVWRYVFDEEGVEDLRCFFDNAPPVEIPEVILQRPKEECPKNLSSKFFLDDDEGFASGGSSCSSPVVPHSTLETLNDDDDDDDGYWGEEGEDIWGSAESPYNLVRNALQSRWITFAYGESPWSRDCVYVFGPEGETGERSKYIFDRRRRQGAWKKAFEPLGMNLVWKIGAELCRGPGTTSR